MPEKLNFEESLQKLEEIAEKLEQGNINLDESVELYAQASKLVVACQKKLGAGFFGGEGFIMQRLSGCGTAFLEFDGHVIEYDLQPGQQIVVDTGYLAAMENTCGIEIQSVPGIKNMVFGGEGLFNTVITGPGRIWLQTMPMSNVAAEILKFMPSK